MKKIEHTWAVVTGASSGIGECICHELAKKKVNIILCGRDEETIHEIQENLETTYGVKTDYFVGDLVEKGEPERLAKTMGGRYHVQFYLIMQEPETMGLFRLFTKRAYGYY